MKKLYAKQFNNYTIDTDIYFDFEEEAKTLKFAINGGRYFKDFTFTEYERIENEFDYFLQEYEEITAENCDDFDFCYDFIYYDYWNTEEFKKYLSKVYGVEIDNITVFTITDTKIIERYVYGEN